MVRFSAVIDNAHLQQIDAIANKLRELGCHIDNVAPITGVITGSTQNIQSLLKHKIAGIEAIEEQRRVKTS